MTDPNTDAQAQPVDEARNFTLEGNDTSGYVGVDPEYRNYANETDRPYLTDDEREHLATVGQPTDEELEAQRQEQLKPAEERAEGDAEVSREDEPADEEPETPGQTKTNDGNKTPSALL